MADHHYRVDKQMIEETPILTEDDQQPSALAEIRTVVRVIPLNTYQTRLEELAQLTGGHSSNDAIAFADSLLTKASAQRMGKKERGGKDEGMRG